MPPTAPTRRFASLVALTACGTLLLTACGGGSGQATAPVPSSAAAVAPFTIAGVRITEDAALHAVLPDAIKQSGQVRVASDIPYAPFEMYRGAGGGAMTGLDYDMGQALGARLGVRFTFQAQKFDGIVPAIGAGRYDVAISAMTDSRQREQVLDFVDYSVSGTGILVAKGNAARITTLDDLCGQKAAVESGTSQQTLLSAHQSACRAAGKGEVTIQAFPKNSDAELALSSGRVVADVMDKPAAGWTARTADGGSAFEVVEDPSAVRGYLATPNGIAVSRSIPGLADAIQRALQSLIDDGTLTKIFDQYGASSITVKQATKNGAVN
ncbi:polar amino acid transport system substrate-binding protein [Kitasatospora sp. MAA4]|uniref:ABC transporter substrate-binding protein n=1 Tax=Kitasatospora sp. MAA4 TaxID=3035093 RepID=UPI00247440B9|nr:ABC transporter substrate-binding protein [Kitasatospora sp. MAA4]MDH6137767.1 polar amino acid transport system substrate-binding protein [Kitasatospora sp. MAA4]